jgi:Na+/proline symporter
LLGVLFSIVYIANALDYSPMEMVNAISKSDYSKTFFWNNNETNYFWKQFLGGMFIAIAMTGLDQNMMQKNLSCPSLKDAQKNINSFSIVVVLVNVFFVSLGALLYIYASQMSIAIPERTDQLFPLLALNHLGIASGLVFIIGLTAATFSSADSVLTTLTTSFYIDFLKKDEQEETEAQTKTLRHWIHVGFAILLLGTILVIKAYNNKAIIDTVFMIAGYTYGPLLGLFFIGIFTQLKVKDSLVPIIAILAPFVSHSIKLVLDTQSLLGLEANNSLDLYTSFLLWIGKSISGLTGTIPAYKTGNEFLILNGVITCLGLWLIAERKKR